MPSILSWQVLNNEKSSASTKVLYYKVKLSHSQLITFTWENSSYCLPSASPLFQLNCLIL
jgi:hypothetical protein